MGPYNNWSQKLKSVCLRKIVFGNIYRMSHELCRQFVVACLVILILSIHIGLMWYIYWYSIHTWSGSSNLTIKDMGKVDCTEPLQNTLNRVEQKHNSYAVSQSPHADPFVSRSQASHQPSEWCIWFAQMCRCVFTNRHKAVLFALSDHRHCTCQVNKMRYWVMQVTSSDY